MARIGTFGIGVRNSSISNGGLTVQPVAPNKGTSEGKNPTTGIDFRGPAAGGSSGASSIGSTTVGPASTLPKAPKIPGIGDTNTPGLPRINFGALDANKLVSGLAGIPALEILKPSVILRPQEYPVDTLNVAETRLLNGQFAPVMDGGIVPFRPEIIGVFDFSPIYRVGTRIRNSELGDFVDIQYQASHLRKETLLKLVNKIQKRNDATTSDDSFNAIRERYKREIKEVETALSYFQDILSNIEAIKNSLQVKQIPKSFYNASFLPMEEFFAKKMQFTKNQYSIFSDSKILGQLLFDFRAILENYSISLLDLKDPDREQDYNPITIDKTYTNSSGFTFNIANLRSVTVPVNATDVNFFNAFVNSLPQNFDDRIKLLIVLLSKEYLVSRGLGRQDIQRLLQNFGAQSFGNPFDNLIGEPGNSIFERPRGQNSLSSLLFIEPGIPNAKVLPFESKYVDSNDQKSVYVPGSTYFADSILSLQDGKWNTSVFVNYVNLYNNRLREVKNIVEEIFSLNNLSTPIAPNSLSDAIMNSLKASISTLSETESVSADQGVIAALFKLASTDNELKLLLFQFSILVGMAANAASMQKEIFDVLARSELSSLRSLSYLQIPDGVEPNPARGQSVIRPYIEQLADLIEKRVVVLTTKIAPNYRRILETAELFRSLRTFRTSNLSSMRASSILAGSTALRSIGFTNFNKTSNNYIVTIHLQRGNIARILKSLTSSGGDNRTNFIEEFVETASNLFKAAQIQGTNAHLLQDGTNRTRYNFLSISTQLLILFEIFFAYASRYAFASFEKNAQENESTIVVDTLGNKAIISTIDNIIKRPVFNNIRNIIDIPIGPGKEGIKSVLGGGPTIRPVNNISLGGSFVISRPGTSKTGISSRIVATPGEGVDGGRQRFSNSVYNSISSDIRDSLAGSKTYTETAAANINAANLLKNILLGLGRDDLIRETIRNADKYLSYKESLASNRNKILEEINAIGNCLHLLTAVGFNLQKGSNIVQKFFNQATLQTFIRDFGFDNLELLKNPAQLRAASYVFHNIKEKMPAQDYNAETGYVYNNLVISDTVTTQEYRLFRALMASNPFVNSTMASPSAKNRVKLLSVGIPNGFSQQLADRVNIGEINANSYADKQFDVISVNVYKRDARFDDLVFKPKRYLFDLSLFVLETDIIRINPGADENYARLLERAQITDFTNIRNPKKIDIAKIKNDEKYNFLSADEVSQMVRNHYMSYLLQLYINFVSGINITEDAFLAGKTRKTKNLASDIQRIVFTYLKDVMRVSIPAGQTIEELLQNPNIDEDAKDILRLFDYGSIVFNEREISKRVLTPKLFDRVFNVPLNIEDFEIDVDKTLATDSGRRAWSQSYLQEKLVVTSDGRYFLKPRSKNDLIFEDYFVAIETANDREES
jgi:hypothetical protein